MSRFSSWHRQSLNPVRLERDRSAGRIAGVAAGLARFLGVRPVLVRVLFILATVFFFPFPILVYGALWVILPNRHAPPPTMDAETEAFWRGVATSPARTADDLRGRFRSLDDRLQQLERVVTSDAWRLKRQFRDLERGS
ncbi:MAG: PspC domain-containing protein [Alphaproteobacteria bacterium]|nr:PspC domain-containing protein [Alphaproteobacteria bacterium]TAD89213.1 MAG: PspC domain-containing protein [Alphaproteobacteria bacterium]